MSFAHILKTAVAGLVVNKARSALTMLGIVIGIVAVIMMMSLGKGAERLIISQIGNLGAETIIIRPGREPKGPSDVGQTLFSDSLKNRDVQLLQRKENAPYIVDVMPVLLVPGSLSYRGETFTPTLIGGTVAFFVDAFGVRLAEGRLFDEHDIRDQSAVIVIGAKVRRELFGDATAIGEYVRIKDRSFRVIGTLASKGQTGIFNFDEVAVVPHTAAQKYLLGINHYHEIIVRTTGPDAVARTVVDIEATLREAHRISSPAKDDFFIVTQQGVVEQVQTILGALTAFLSSVVAIGLVIGGIGIMNIMLVSVTERTREIGLRKAIGATEGDILKQFLVEAILLTGVGGLVGVILGALFSYGLTLALRTFAGLDWQFVFPLSAVWLGLSVSAAVGLVFGIYPARQAARKDPIEALRYE